MKVLVTGSAGQVGYEVLRTAPLGMEVVGLDSQALDITDADAVAKVFAEVKPQAVINAAAYTAVDKAEAEPERAYAVNQSAVAHLGLDCERLGIPMLHLSTDYVFAGDACAPYAPEAICAPSGVYGASKLAGEHSLAQVCTRHVIVRTSWVFGAHGQNFVKTMLRLAQTRDQLSVVADQVGGPTSAAGIATMLWQVLLQYQARGDLPWGTYHFSGAPACTWHAFAQAIFAQAVAIGLLAQAPVVSPISTAEYPTPARRPAWSVLDCSSLERAFAVRPDDWQAALHAVLSELVTAQNARE